MRSLRHCSGCPPRHRTECHHPPRQGEDAAYGTCNATERLRRLCGAYNSSRGSSNAIFQNTWALCTSSSTPLRLNAAQLYPVPTPHNPLPSKRTTSRCWRAMAAALTATSSAAYSGEITTGIHWIARRDPPSRSPGAAAAVHPSCCVVTPHTGRSKPVGSTLKLFD